MKHDERCEFNRKGWRRCYCAERAYVTTATPQELAEWLDATGAKIEDLYQ